MKKSPGSDEKDSFDLDKYLLLSHPSLLTLSFLYIDRDGLVKCSLLHNLLALGKLGLGVHVILAHLVHALVVFERQLVLAEGHVGGRAPVIRLQVGLVVLDSLVGVREGVAKVFDPEVGDGSATGNNCNLGLENGGEM
jgi:hypothetical protein